MKVKLTRSSFFNYFIGKPLSKKLCSTDRKIATLLTILTILPLGIIYLICRFCFYDKAFFKKNPDHPAIKTHEAAQDSLLKSPVNWDEIIVEYPTDSREFMKIKKQLKKLDIQHCHSKQIFLRFCRTSSTFPTFTDDGAYRNYKDFHKFNPEECQLIFVELDKGIPSFQHPSNFPSMLKAPDCIAPLNIPIKLFYYNDWAQSHRLSSRAIECLATDKNNINFNFIKKTIT